MATTTLKIKKVGQKNPKTKVLGFASRAIANGTADYVSLAKSASKNTTVHWAELQVALQLALEAAAQEVKNGKVVDLGPLGKIRPAVSGKWVEKEEDLTINDLTPHLNYVPSDDLKAAIRSVKMAWTTEKATEDDEQNGGDTINTSTDNTSTNNGGDTPSNGDNNGGGNTGGLE